MYKKILVSNTSINTFYQDKTVYREKYINNKKYPSPNSKHLSFGNSLHNTLNKFNMLPLDEQTFDNLEVLLNKNWIVEGYSSNEEMLENFIRAKSILSEYFVDRKDFGKLLLSEEMIFYNVNPNLTICGKIDKVFINDEGKVELLDYKTGAATNLMIDVNTDLQLPLYIVLLKYKLNLVPNIISYYYLCNNTKVSLNITEDVINLCLERLKLIIHEMSHEYKIYCAR